MKKVFITLTATVFVFGLATAALAQTTKTPEKPAVKTEAPAATVVKPEGAKSEGAQPGVTKPEGKSMNEEIKVHFVELDKRIESNDKRFDDIKWYLGGVTILFTIVFSVIVLLISWNFNSEKTNLRADFNSEKIDLREFKKDIRAELGKTDKPPKLLLFGRNGEPLENQDIIVGISKHTNGNVKLDFDIIIKNEGDSASGTIYYKFYSSPPIDFFHISTDEPKYKYELYATVEQLIPGGNYSCDYHITLELTNKDLILKGKYPMLLKAYYGKGKVVRTNFNLIIP